ncbi:two-component sensor histidine kinase [Actinoplanes capillaceus]|uniref:histidine kinase n=1 Tax=Actinoplanes campanulatus TaxID=113559 RepID=A0ABQ3WPH1_9ACTN|nr:HAMP domain-containing sensor histidine kinase [Actinoplanes capillaceus]GID48075.1 two-component sensor histidine kinase [Actinoplanes capillaceus]
MMLGSLRVRLLAIALLILTCGIVISDVVVAGLLRQHLVSRVDRQVAGLAALMARIDPALMRAADDVASERLRGGLDLVSDLSLIYFDAAGQPIGRTRTTRDGPAPEPPPATLTPPGVVTGVRGGDGSAWRQIAQSRPGGGTVTVAASLSAVDAVMARLRLVCAATGAVLVLLLGAAGWMAIRAAFRPLRAIEDAAVAIAGGDLSRRIPARAPPGSEVARLTGVLNGMLDRIEEGAVVRAESEARMRRFVADVSHELRTPLFGIAGSAELHLMGGGAEVDRTMRRIDSEARRLTDLVENLLLLARLDESRAVPETAPMDLRTLAVDARDDLLALDPGRPVVLTGPLAGSAVPVSGASGVTGLSCGSSGTDRMISAAIGPPSAAPVVGDEARLRQVVTNLVGNVHAHTPAGSPVRIGVGRLDGESVLEIADSGPGIPPGQAELIFERFHRGDGARVRDGRGGAGLGLSIVRSLVTAHGGRVEAVSPPGGGATFRLRFPAISEAPDADPSGSASENVQELCGNGQERRPGSPPCWNYVD